MVDNKELIAALKAQDLNALSNGLPDVAPTHPAGAPQNWHEWVTRNVLEPAQYAGFYPLRVLSRYMDPQRQNPFWEGNMPGPASRAHPKDLADAANVVWPAIDKLGSYTPGERMSDNFEDRRPRSIWEY